jgi:hypothetical protein
MERALIRVAVIMRGVLPVRRHYHSLRASWTLRGSLPSAGGRASDRVSARRERGRGGAAEPGAGPASGSALLKGEAPFYTSRTFFSGRLRTGLPVAARMALSTAGATTEIVGSPTPPQKSPVGTITVSTLGISARRMIS